MASCRNCMNFLSPSDGSYKCDGFKFGSWWLNTNVDDNGAEDGCIGFKRHWMINEEDLEGTK